MLRYSLFDRVLPGWLQPALALDVIPPKPDCVTSTSVFLIDTNTGQGKRYVNKTDSDGRYLEGWVSTSRTRENR